MRHSTISTVALVIFDVSGHEKIIPIAAFDARDEADDFGATVMAAFTTDRDAYVASSLPILQDMQRANRREAARTAAAPFIARWAHLGITEVDFSQSCGSRPRPGFEIRVIDAPKASSAIEAAQVFHSRRLQSTETACS